MFSDDNILSSICELCRIDDQHEFYQGVTALGSKYCQFELTECGWVFIHYSKKYKVRIDEIRSTLVISLHTPTQTSVFYTTNNEQSQKLYKFIIDFLTQPDAVARSEHM
jgi:hypothetical protein